MSCEGHGGGCQIQSQWPGSTRASRRSRTRKPPRGGARETAAAGPQAPVSGAAWSRGQVPTPPASGPAPGCGMIDWSLAANRTALAQLGVGRGGAAPGQLPARSAIYSAEPSGQRPARSGARGWLYLRGLVVPLLSRSGRPKGSETGSPPRTAARSAAKELVHAGRERRSSRPLGAPCSRTPCSGRVRATRPVADGARRPGQHPCTARSESRRLQLRRGSGTGGGAAAVGGVNGSPFQLHLHLAAARTLRHGRAAHQRWVPTGQPGRGLPAEGSAGSRGGRRLGPLKPTATALLATGEASSRAGARRSRQVACS